MNMTGRRNVIAQAAVWMGTFHDTWCFLLCKSARTISSITRTSHRQNKNPSCPYAVYRISKRAFQHAFIFFFQFMILHIQAELGELQVQPMLITTVQDDLVV